MNAQMYAVPGTTYMPASLGAEPVAAPHGIRPGAGVSLGGEAHDLGGAGPARGGRAPLGR